LKSFGFDRTRSVFYNPETKKTQRKTITKEILERAGNVTFTHDFVFMGGRVELHQLADEGRNHQTIMQSFAHMIPDNTRVIVNLLDEPRVLPLPEDFIPISTKSQCELGKSRTMNEDVVRLLARCNTSCSARAVRYRHGFFIRPASVEFVHDLIPLFSPTKIDGCLQDITSPYVPSSGTHHYILRRY
jgi:hypothetical protein